MSMSLRLFARRFVFFSGYRAPKHNYQCYSFVHYKRFSYFTCNYKFDLNKLTKDQKYSTPTSSSVGTLSQLEYERISHETLEALTEYFEELIEDCPHLKNPDIIFGDGVLTVQFGEPYGTYVINRQTPNLQIWLSSPTTGPKRYDFIDGQWIYRHDGVSLNNLLNEEIAKIVKCDVQFNKCLYSKSS